MLFYLGLSPREKKLQDIFVTLEKVDVIDKLVDAESPARHLFKSRHKDRLPPSTEFFTPKKSRAGECVVIVSLKFGLTPTLMIPPRLKLHRICSAREQFWTLRALSAFASRPNLLSGSIATAQEMPSPHKKGSNMEALVSIRISDYLPEMEVCLTNVMTNFCSV